MQGPPYGSLDLHDIPMQMHPPNSGNQVFNQPQIPGNFTIPMDRVADPDNMCGVQLGEHGKIAHHHHRHHTKNYGSDEEEHDMSEEAADTQSGKGKKDSAWHRMKWTDSMVKLLITAVSYTGEDPGADLGGGKRNISVMHKKGKWKAISKVLGERGCHVSPQQCEDKFNDLNKRYKRLTDILGRGTACDVVENHALLDQMNNLSDKMKEDARKILSSRHLFYEEMCSYHNNNRINLPEDPALQHSLQLALRCKEEHELRRDASGDAEQDDGQSEDSDYENDEEHQTVDTNIRGASMHKRMWHVVDHGDVGYVPSCSNDGSGRSDPYGAILDINKAFPEGTDLALVQKDLALKAAELQKHCLQVEVKALQLAKRRLKWERFRKNKDREMEMMALENEQMMLEIKRFELELRSKELELEIKIKGNANRA
ncbi:hypothetical protein ABZP36_009239 [Zizania latifolia]